jgi:hypothetical protein
MERKCKIALKISFFVIFILKIGLAHSMISSHFILPPKAEGSKGQLFFPQRGTFTRLLGFGLSLQPLGKVETAISIKISNCLYLETRFLVTINI